MSRGVLFKYKDKDGKECLCAAYGQDQTHDLYQKWKLLVTKLDKSYSPIIENGHPVKVIKNMSSLVQIGFIVD